MKVFKYKIPNNCNIMMFSCTHHGTLNSYQEGIDKMVNAIQSSYDGLPAKNNRAIDFGDTIEGILPDDPRYCDGVDAGGRVFRQLQTAVDVRMPIKDKIITGLLGNHEWKLWKFGSAEEMIWDRLGVPFGTFSCIIEYVNKKGMAMFRQFATHGRMTFNSRIPDPKERDNTMRRGLRRALQYKADDCLVMTQGHAHKVVIDGPIPILSIKSENGRVKQSYLKQDDQAANHIDPDLRWYACVGSFLKTYGDGTSGYAELLGLDPIPLGYCVMRIRDGRMIDIVPEYV